MFEIPLTHPLEVATEERACGVATNLGFEVLE
jgi:hypothetical protein